MIVISIGVAEWQLQPTVQPGQADKVNVSICTTWQDSLDMCTYVHACIHTYIYTYAHTYIHTCMDP